MSAEASPSQLSTGLEFTVASPMGSTPYLLGPVFGFAGDLGPEKRVLDVGCGNGFWAGEFARRGCRVVGIDPSESGIDLARGSHAALRFEVMEITPDVLTRLAEEPFDIVVSTEVVEHLYSPQDWAEGCINALRPGGVAIVSTPYHGWLKNLALAATGKLDRHLDALREGGHIKFFSQPVLTQLLTEAGFDDVRFAGAGRVPLMWKSMVLAATKPR
jgi:2-polyprenyl-6-hydroxyphenyl methylase/3-demethylubiquinone-9 3-methyltransferase